MQDESPLTPLLTTFVANRSTFVAFAARFLGCRAHAEDVVQDTFLRLQKTAEVSIPLTSQMAYLFQIVRNLAIDLHRKLNNELRYAAGSDESLLVEAAEGASPENLHINQTTLSHIDAALSQLPERTRYAFEMYRVYGVPQKDIALALGVSATLVNFMIRDGLLHCRRYLARVERDGR